MIDISLILSRAVQLRASRLTWEDWSCTLGTTARKSICAKLDKICWERFRRFKGFVSSFYDQSWREREKNEIQLLHFTIYKSEPSPLQQQQLSDLCNCQAAASLQLLLCRSKAYLCTAGLQKSLSCRESQTARRAFGDFQRNGKKAR